MILNDKTLEKLRILINEEIKYKSGPDLVNLFNKYGFNDSYGQGFPSRWKYTDEKLSKINGTPEIDKLIKEVFSPINFIENPNNLEKFILDFNQYLKFDGWKLNIESNKIYIIKYIEEKNIKETPKTEKEFLNFDYGELDIKSLNFEELFYEIILNRVEEIKVTINNRSPLATIFLIGSTLEGILLNFAYRHIPLYNRATASPKLNGKVKNLPDWSLNNLIDVAYEVGHLKEDVKKFSHAVRDFRNYIHPYQQMYSNFNPSIDTAKICWQVLHAVVNELKLVK